MTVHIRSLPDYLRSRVISHPAFRNALLVAQTSGDYDWLALNGSALQAQSRNRESAARACVRVFQGLLLWAKARDEALHSLALACGATLVRRRAEAENEAEIEGSREPVDALMHELESYSMNALQTTQAARLLGRV